MSIYLWNLHLGKRIYPVKSENKIVIQPRTRVGVSAFIVIRHLPIVSSGLQAFLEIDAVALLRGRTQLLVSWRQPSIQKIVRCARRLEVRVARRQRGDLSITFSIFTLKWLYHTEAPAQNRIITVVIT